MQGPNKDTAMTSVTYLSGINSFIVPAPVFQW